MDTQDYLTAIREGINTLGMEWTTTVAPAARWKSHTLTKISTAVCLTGVEYRNLAVNADVETGEPQPAAQPPRVQQVQRFTEKVGRNDPCPCGSGKKYKKCHGMAAAA